MDFSKHKWGHYAWFFGGFLVGLTLISLGHAALPSRATPNTNTHKALTSNALTEMNGGKAQAPDLDPGFTSLNSLESQYAESYDQQQRLKQVSSRVASGQLKSMKKLK